MERRPARNAEIEQQGGSSRHFADIGYFRILEIGRQERVSRNTTSRYPWPRPSRGQTPSSAMAGCGCDLPPSARAPARYCSRKAIAMVMPARNRRRHVMAAHEQEEDREGDDDREHPLHDDGRHVEIVAHVSPLLGQDVRHRRHSAVLLFRHANAFMSGTETAELGKHGKRTMARTAISPNVSKPRKSTRMTLTTLVPPLRYRPVPEIGGDRIRHRQRHHGVAMTDMPIPLAAASRKSRARRSCAGSSSLLSTFSKRFGSTETSRMRNRGDDFHQQLGDGEIRRGKPHEGEAGDKPGDAEHDEAARR